MTTPALRFDMHTEPSLGGLSFAVSRFVDDLEDLSELFEVFEGMFKTAMREQFATQGDYGAGGWADLTDAYAIWKQRKVGSRPIGYLYGHLRAAMTGGAGYSSEIAADSASFGMGSGKALKYGHYFAEKRPVLAFPPDFGKRLGKAAHLYLYHRARGAFGGAR